MTLLYIILAIIALPVLFLVIAVMNDPTMLAPLWRLLRPVIGRPWTLVVLGLLLIITVLFGLRSYAPLWMGL